MNRYKVFADYGEDIPKSVIQFNAENYNDACFEAAQKIINKYEKLSEESCEILNNSTIKSWQEDCDTVFDLDNLNISDISEIEDD